MFIKKEERRKRWRARKLNNNDFQVECYKKRNAAEWKMTGINRLHIYTFLLLILSINRFKFWYQGVCMRRERKKSHTSTHTLTLFLEEEKNQALNRNEWTARVYKTLNGKLFNGICCSETASMLIGNRFEWRKTVVFLFHRWDFKCTK